MNYTTLIAVDDLANQLANPSWVIVDCRYDLMNAEAGHAAYADSHIPGAIYASVSHDLSGPPLTDCGRHPMPSPEAMQASFSHMGIDQTKQVVIYDASGGSFAARLWWMLQYMGHQNVAVLDGGWQAWEVSSNSTTSGVETNPDADFQGEADTHQLVLLDHVSEASLLIDSRDPDRYVGKVEPIDPAAGHIPGARNHFWQKNLTEEGVFHSPAILAQQFTDLMGATESNDTVFYCGSGVTACHNLLAVAHAGLSRPRLYGGSWSEWCSDASRPVATGADA